MNSLLQLAALFGKLSLLAVGGVNSTLPSIAHDVVDLRHWMTREAFAQLFAIAQSAPGPNMLVVVLIGQRVGGVAGGIVAGLAMVLPAGILPITAGLVLAAAFVLVEDADTSPVLVVVTVVVLAGSLRTKLHPLWLLAGGAAVGLVVG